MLETPHVIVGAAIATKVPNPLISIPLIFASHFVLDMVPHWNPHLNTEKNKFGKVTNLSSAIVVGDVILAFVSGILIATRALPDTFQFFHILAASFISVSPDVIEGPYFFLNMKSKFIRAWIKFQKSIQADTSPLPGLAIQVATVIATLGWILS